LPTTAIGIDSANLQRIFDPFFTTRLGTGGSGLGLYIVYNLVTCTLGGQIRSRAPRERQPFHVCTLPCTAPADGPTTMPWRIPAQPEQATT
jgi:two-component system NtrC family sensor kinase